MKSNLNKILSAILCCTVLIAGIGATAFAVTADKDSDKPQEQPSLSAPEAVEGLAKDETVYVFAAADGSVEKLIVSDWIKNSLGLSSFSDYSELTDIENLKGDEAPKENNSIRVWDTQGNDVYYRGNMEKELPVNIAITYKLDGKSISADELCGKSGRVTIRFDYQNNQFETVDINGKYEKIYVPFAVVSGILLDNDIFTNAEVTNGKLINDGDRTVIIGLAFPGLQENLNIDGDKLEIPDYVEISADTSSFEMTNTLTVATNEVFNSLNLDDLSSADNLSDSLDTLNDAMNQLIDGSSLLYDGLCTLLDKSKDIVGGVEQLHGAGKLIEAGAGALDGGISELKDGINTLYTGLNQLSENNDSLNLGAKQIFDSLLSAANTQLSAAGISIPELTAENYTDILNGIITSLESAGTPSSKVQLAAISELKKQLDSYNSFYTALQQYTAGVTSAKNGVSALNAGAIQLKDGSAELYSGISGINNGITALKDGLPAFTEGITSLKDGALSLSDGLISFNEKGIQKLIDAAGGDISELFLRLKLTSEVSENYKTFSGLSSGMDGQVKFIYRTDSIKIS